jgi:hypothetical protein
MKNEMNGILYTINKPKAIIFSILWSILIIGGIAAIGFGLTEGEGFLISWIFIVFGVGLILYFGFSLIRNIKNIISSDAGLLLDSSGIHDQTKLFRSEIILWKDIYLVHISPQLKMMSVELVDANKFLNGKNYILRWWGKMYYGTYGSPVIISLMYLNHCGTPLFQEINNKISEYSKTASSNNRESVISREKNISN